MPPKKSQNDLRKVVPEPPTTTQRSARVQVLNPPVQIPRQGPQQRLPATDENIMSFFKKKNDKIEEKPMRRETMTLLEESKDQELQDDEEIEKKILKKIQLENRYESSEEVDQNKKFFFEEEKSMPIEEMVRRDSIDMVSTPEMIFPKFEPDIEPRQEIILIQQQKEQLSELALNKKKLIKRRKKEQKLRIKAPEYVIQKRQIIQSNWDGSQISKKQQISFDNENIEKMSKRSKRLPRMAIKEKLPILIVYGKQNYSLPLFKNRRIIRMLENVEQVNHARGQQIYDTDDSDIILRLNVTKMNRVLVKRILLQLGLEEIDIQYLEVGFRELALEYTRFKNNFEHVSGTLDKVSLIVQNIVMKGLGIITRLIQKILNNSTLTAEKLTDLSLMRLRNLKGNFVENLMNDAYLSQMQEVFHETFSNFGDLFLYLYNSDAIYNFDYEEIKAQIINPLSQMYLFTGDQEAPVGLHHTKQLKNYVDFVLQMELKRDDFSSVGFTMLPEKDLQNSEYNYMLEKQRRNMFQFYQIFVLNSLMLNYVYEYGSQVTRGFLNIFFSGNTSQYTVFDMKYRDEEISTLYRVPLRWLNIGYFDKLQEMVSSLVVERIQEWRYFNNNSQGFLCSHINTQAFTSGIITVDASNNIVPSNAFEFLDSGYDGLNIDDLDGEIDWTDLKNVDEQKDKFRNIVEQRFRELAELVSKELYFDDSFTNQFDKNFIKKELCIQFMFKILSNNLQVFRKNKDGTFKFDINGKKIPAVILDVNDKEHFVWNKDPTNKQQQIKGFERAYIIVKAKQWNSWFSIIQAMKVRSKQMTDNVEIVPEVSKDPIFQEQKRILINLLTVLIRDVYKQYDDIKNGIILKDGDGEVMLTSNTLVEIAQRDVLLQLDRLYFNFYDDDIMSDTSARDLRYKNILNYKDPRTNQNKPTQNNEIHVNNVFAGAYYFSQYYSKEYLEFIKQVDFNQDCCLYSLAYYLNKKFGVMFEDQQPLKDGNVKYFLQTLIEAKAFNISYLDFQNEEFQNFDFDEDLHTVGIAVFNNHIFETDCNFQKIKAHLDKVKKDSLGIQIRQYFTQEINDMTDQQSLSNRAVTLTKILLKTNKTLQLCGNNICVTKQQLFIFYDLETTCNEDNIDVIVLSFCLVQQIEGEVDTEQFKKISTLVVLKVGDNIVEPFVRLIRRQYELGVYEKILVGGWNSNKFDNILILKELFKVFKRDQICLKGSTNNIKFMCVGQTIYFTDFMKATCVQMSLQKFTEQFGKGIKKHGTEEEKNQISKIMRANVDLNAWIQQTEEDKKLYIQYCENDVFSMCMSIFNFNGVFIDSVRSIKAECLPKKSPKIFTINSLPQTAFKLMKAVVIKGEIQVLYQQQQYNAARQSYRGGITQIFQMKKYQLGVNSAELQYIDVNSLYPSVMQKFPFFNLGIVCKDVSEAFIEPNEIQERHLYGLEKFKLPQVPFGKYGYIPISDMKTGQLTYPTIYQGPEIQYVWGFQLLQIYKICQEYNVAEQLIFKFKFMFLGSKQDTKQFEDIQVLYDARKKYEKEGNKTQAQIYKLIMNSAYGQFGMKEFDASIYVQSEYYDELNRNKASMHSYIKNTLLEQLENPKNLTISKIDRNDEVGLIRLDFKKIEKTIPQGQKQRLVHIASQITARSRDVLLKKIYSLNLKGIEVIYCDTDSIIYSRPQNIQHNIKEDEDIDGEILGKWKQEVEKIISVRCYAPKLYQIQYEEKDKDGNIIIKDILRSKGVSFKDMKKEQIKQMYLDLDQCSDNYLNNQINQGVVVKNQIAFYRKQGAIAINEIQKTLKIKNWRGREYFI